MVTAKGSQYRLHKDSHCKGQYRLHKDTMRSPRHLIPTGSGKSLCYRCLPLLSDTLRARGSKAIVVQASAEP